MLTLTTKPAGNGRFEIIYDGQTIGRSRQPLFDGARLLLGLGCDPDQMLTIRAHDVDYDSFKPLSVGEAAKWAISERDSGGFALRRWAAFPHAGLELSDLEG